MVDHEDGMPDEVRAALRWMADLVDPTTDPRPALRRARRRLARTLAVSAVSVTLCVYGGFAVAGALTRVSPQMPHPATASLCDRTWTIVRSADVPGESSELAAVAAVAHHDVWAVGYHFRTRPHYRPLTEHWDGTRWKLVSGASTTGDGLLLAVVAGGPKDVWAGGYVGGRLLLEHWDGTEWTAVSAPNPGSSSFVGSLALISPHDIWAVGGFEANGRSKTLALHWDGGAWTEVSTPNVKGRDTTLNAVAAVGRSEVWAVGSSVDLNGASKPFVIRWDGDGWRSVRTPSPEDGGMLTDVGAHRDGTVWAVGTNDAVTAGIILRWDGSAWIGVPSPVEGANFIGVSVFDPSDAFAYGNSNGFSESLIEHWDGAAWTTQPAPSPGTSFNGISDLQEAGGWRWAVGAETEGAITRTLVLRSCTGR